MSGSVEAVPPTAPRNRSIDAPLWCAPRTRRQEPIVKLLNRGASVARIATQAGVMAERSRPEMTPQGFEKIDSAPGNGMASQTSSPKIWYKGPTRPSLHSPLAEWENTSDWRGACLSGIVAGKWRRKGLKTLISRLEMVWPRKPRTPKI